MLELTNPSPRMKHNEVFADGGTRTRGRHNAIVDSGLKPSSLGRVKGRTWQAFIFSGNIELQGE
jgi:hypothetical protein